MALNQWTGIGRLTADPQIKTTQGERQYTVANYTLAVEKSFKRDGGATADFINCVAFGKQADFAEKFLKKGLLIGVKGRLETGSYKNKDGNTVYTWQINVDEHTFCQSKKDAQAEQKQEESKADDDPRVGNTAADDGFMDMPDDLDEQLPFA